MWSAARSRHFWLLCFLHFGIAICSALPAFAQIDGARRVGDWASGSGQGYTEYRTTRGRSYISVSCDIAATEDHGGTGISIEIDGSRLPPDSEITFDVDGQRIAMRTNAFGGLSTADCEECSHGFYQLWPLLREGRRLEVAGPDGRRTTFSLRGTARLLPAEPCATAFPANRGEQTNGTAESASIPTSETEDAARTPPAPEAVTTDAPAESSSSAGGAGSAGRMPAGDQRCRQEPASLAAARVTHRDRNRIVFSAESESVVVGREPTAWIFDAGDGDDTIYAIDPPDVAVINTGQGADTLVICTMTGPSLQISLSGDTVSDDLAPDEIVIEPEVFLGLPDGIERQIFIFGFTQGSDRVRLRLPPGTEFVLERPGASVTARAGKVAFSILRADSPYGVDEKAFVIEQVDDVPAVAAVPADAPLASYDRTLSCADSDSLDVSQPSERLADIAYYAADGPLRIGAAPGGATHQTGEDDDQVLVYTSQTIDPGGGADMVVVCALDEPYAGIAVGRGRDLHADTVVVETGRLQDGIERELHVSNLTLLNDRVVLRVPEGMDVSFVNNTSGVPAVARIGDLSVTLGVGDWDQEARSKIDMFIVERSDEPVSVGSGPAPARDVSTITCGDLDSREGVDPGTVDPRFHNHVTFTNGDDVAMPGAGVDSVVAGDGDDLIYVRALGEGFGINAGLGGDTIVLCAMTGVYLNATLGGDALMSDISPDSVIVAPEVFAGVPQGLDREIDIFGFMPGNDKLVLRLPAGVTAGEVRDTRTGAAVVRAGNVEITLYRADDWQRKPFNYDSVVVEPTQVSIPDDRPIPPAVDPLHLSAACPDPEGKAEYASPPDSLQFDPESRFFGPEDDKILIKAEPGVLSYDAGDGDDTVYVFDPVANTGVGLGRGSNLLILCSMSEIGFTAGMPSSDVQPDTVIIEFGALADVPGDLVRNIGVYNVVPINDRVVLRLPPGVDASIEGTATGKNTLFAVVGDTRITVSLRNGPDEPFDHPVIVLQRTDGSDGAMVPTPGQAGDVTGPEAGPNEPARATVALAADTATSSGTAPGRPVIGEWVAIGDAGEGRLSALATASDGETSLTIGCNRLLGTMLAGSLEGYTGDGLGRIDERLDTLVFEFVDAKGRRDSVSGQANYYAPDKAWAFRDYPAGMLEPFARGSSLRLRNGAGGVIAEFGLKGSARARAAMRDACGF